MSSKQRIIDFGKYSIPKTDKKMKVPLTRKLLRTTATFVTKHDDDYVRTASDPAEILNGDFTNRKLGPSCRSPAFYTEGYPSNSHLLNTEQL